MPKLNRDWRRFLIVFGGISLLVGLAALALPEYRSLAILFFYSIPANSVIPVPHEPGMVYFGQYYHPAVVALVATGGTLLACFIDYQAINRAFQARRFRRIRNTDVYQGAIGYFLKAPFFAVFIAAIAPFIPFYIFRVLSPTSGYPLRRYMLAVVLGRYPRYFLFALLGSTLNFTNLMLVGGTIFVMCAFLCAQVKGHLARRGRAVESIDQVTVQQIVAEELAMD